MRRIAIIFLIVLPLLLAACGSAAPAATQPTATQLPAIQPSFTAEVPTEAPAATEPAATEPPASSGTGTQVDITLVDNKIQSPVTTFQVGVPYTFVITNAGQRGHNFNISTPISEVGSLEAALQTALLAVPQSELGPGASVTVEYTFPDSAAGQNLEFSCLIRMHYQDGMLLGITVTN
ncbi:MAG TPA: hypothetical protein VNA23_02980 [Anaerolineales bacterium]|nr:hypothetical protein [Anaerolineales bacterium]